MKSSLSLVLIALVSGCSSAYVKQIGGDTDRHYSKTFITDYDLVWDSVQDALKTERFDLTNKDTGFIQTRWNDNTAAMNTLESVQGAHSFVKSEYRMKVVLSKTFYEGIPAVRVSVQKDQVIQQDILDRPRVIETNGIDENTFLYRIARLIVMKQKVDAYDKEQKEMELQQTAPQDDKKVN
ncbi:MAG: hypothetical protein KA715_05570 [Xanthomonadaceae bacterium]|nr:hypothetical protein [Xanthomonadaceae bacterium]